MTRVRDGRYSEYRSAIAPALAKVGGEAAVDVFLLMLSKNDLPLLALESLAAIKSPRIVDAVVSFAKSVPVDGEHEYLYEAGVRALTAQDDPRAVELPLALYRQLNLAKDATHSLKPCCVYSILRAAERSMSALQDDVLAQLSRLEDTKSWVVLDEDARRTKLETISFRKVRELARKEQAARHR